MNANPNHDVQARHGQGCPCSVRVRSSYRLRTGTLLVLLIALAACGKEHPPSAPVEAPLIYAQGKDAISLDPAQIEEGESAKVTTNLFDTLVQFGMESLDVEPGLATGWSIAEDGLTYRFRLRPDVQFHDGTVFDATAAAFSLGRLAFADHPYAPAKRPYAFALESVKSIEVAGPLELEIRLKTPHAPFLRDLAMFCCGIVSPDAVKKEGAQFGERPVGTGPFRFVSWTRDVEIQLAANEGFWDGAPLVSRLIYRPIAENSVRLDSLIRGDVQIMDGIDTADIDRIRENAGLRLINSPGMNVGYCGFSCQKPPFDDVRVRRAAAHAVDREKICKYLFRETARTAQGVLPEMMPGRNPMLQPPEYDPAKARDLLAEAGYPQGFSTRLFTYTNPRPYNPLGARLAEVIQGDLRAVGIKAEIVQLEWAAYLQTVRNDEPPMYLLGWIGDNGDADNFLYPLLVSGQNHSRYDNKEFQRLVEEAKREADDAKRESLYQAAEEIAVGDSPWIFINHSDQMAATAAGLAGFTLHPTGLYRLHRVRFENPPTQ